MGRARVHRRKQGTSLARTADEKKNTAAAVAVHRPAAATAVDDDVPRARSLREVLSGVLSTSVSAPNDTMGMLRSVSTAAPLSDNANVYSANDEGQASDQRSDRSSGSVQREHRADPSAEGHSTGHDEDKQQSAAIVAPTAVVASNDDNNADDDDSNNSGGDAEVENFDDVDVDDPDAIKQPLCERLTSLPPHGGDALYSSSMFIFPAEWLPRIFVYRCLNNNVFEAFMICIIVANCVFLAIDNPLEKTPPPYQPGVDIFFTAVFAAEMVFKWFALGVFAHRGAYFRDAWNYLDFFIVVVSFLNFLPGVGNYTSLRTLRVLRPLRSMTVVKGLRVMMNCLVTALPALLNVAGLTIFCVLLFAIIGVAFFGGSYRQFCAQQQDNITVVNTQMSCSMSAVGVSYLGYACPANWTCIQSDTNPLYGRYHFDNVITASLLTFSAMTFDNWTVCLEIAYATIGVPAWLWFFAVCVICGFFIPNLIVAVLMEEFFQAQDRLKKETRKTNEAKKRERNSRRLALEAQLQAREAAERHLVERNRRHKLAAAARAAAENDDVKGVRSPLRDPSSNNASFDPSASGRIGGVPKLAALFAQVNAQRKLSDVAAAGKLVRQLSTSGSSGDRSQPAGVAMVNPLVADPSNGMASAEAANDADPLEYHHDGLPMDGTPSSGDRAAVDRRYQWPRSDKPWWKFALFIWNWLRDQCHWITMGYLRPVEEEPPTSETNSDEDDAQRAERKRHEAEAIEAKRKAAEIARRIAEEEEEMEDEDEKRRRLDAEQDAEEKAHPPTPFQNFITGIILLNTLTLGSEYYGQPDWLTLTQYYSNIVFTAIFTLEFVLKILSLGPKRFALDPFNVLDISIVVISYVEIGLQGGGGAVSMLRALRLLRILKLLRSIPALKPVVRVSIFAFKDTANLLIIIFLFIFIGTLLGMSFFGGQLLAVQAADVNRNTFDSFLEAFYTVFSILTMDSWVVTMYEAMFVLGDVYFIYFCVGVIILNYILVSLFLSIVISSFDSLETVSPDGTIVDDLMTSIQLFDMGIATRVFHRGRMTSSMISRLALSSQLPPASMPGAPSNINRSKKHSALKAAADDDPSPIYASSVDDADPPSPVVVVALSPPPPATSAAVPNNTNKQKQQPLVGADFMSSGFAERGEPLRGDPVSAAAEDSPALFVDGEEVHLVKFTPSVQRELNRAVNYFQRSGNNAASLSFDEEHFGAHFVGDDGDASSRSSSAAGGRRPRDGDRAGGPEMDVFSASMAAEKMHSLRRQESWKRGAVVVAKQTSDDDDAADDAAGGDRKLPPANMFARMQREGAAKKRDPDEFAPFIVLQDKPKETAVVVKDEMPYCERCGQQMEVPLPSAPLILQLRAPKLHAVQCRYVAIRVTKERILRGLQTIVNFYIATRIPVSPGKVEAIVGQAWQAGLLLHAQVATFLKAPSPYRLLSEELKEQAAVIDLRVGEEQVGRSLIAFACANAIPVHHTNGGWSLFLFSPTNPLRVVMSELISTTSFDRFILFTIVCSTIVMAIDSPLNDPNSTQSIVINWMNVAFTAIFTIEMIVKVIAKGLLFYKGAYLRDAWNVLDCFIVITSIVSIAASSLNIGFFKVFRTLRALRPLRFVNRNRGLKLVVRTLMASVGGIIDVVVLCIINFLIFGILGVQLFKGNAHSCTDVTVTNMADCSGTYFDPNWQQNMTRQWIDETYTNFDHVGVAVLALLEVMGMDNWNLLMYRMIDGCSDTTGPQRNCNLLAGLYFIAFLAVGGFFLVNLFVGVVIHNFEVVKQEIDGCSLMSDDQKLWIATQQLMLNFRPSAALTPNPNSQVSMTFYRIVKLEAFDIVMAVIITLNTISICLDHYGQSDDWTRALNVTNYVFVGIFVVEATMKILAYRRRYFLNSWNAFDFFLVALSLAGVFVDLFATSINLGALRALRLLRVLRLLRLIRAAKSVRILVETVFFSLPQLANIGIFSLLIDFMFGVLGVDLFAKVNIGWWDRVMNIGHANFRSLDNSLMFLWRFQTVTDWNRVMHDCMITPPYCDPSQDNCGTPFAPLYFVGFIIVMAYVTNNLLIGVIIDNHETTMQLDRTAVKMTTLHRFGEIWAEIDEDATLMIPTNRVPVLLAKLQPPMGVTRRQNRFELLSTTARYRIPEHAGSVHFIEVFIPLARAALEADTPLKLTDREHRKHESTWRMAFPELDELPILRYRQHTVTVDQYLSSTFIAAAYRSKVAVRLARRMRFEKMESIMKHCEENFMNFGDVHYVVKHMEAHVELMENRAALHGQSKWRHDKPPTYFGAYRLGENNNYGVKEQIKLSKRRSSSVMDEANAAVDGLILSAAHKKRGGSRRGGANSGATNSDGSATPSSNRGSIVDASMPPLAMPSSSSPPTLARRGSSLRGSAAADGEGGAAAAMDKYSSEIDRLEEEERRRRESVIPVKRAQNRKKVLPHKPVPNANDSLTVVATLGAAAVLVGGLLPAGDGKKRGRKDHR